MKMFHLRRKAAAFFLPGFFLGVVYVNFLAKKYSASPEIFSEFFLRQFAGTEIDTEEYLWYLLKIRAVPMLILGGCSLTGIRRFLPGILFLWTGLSAGLLISSAVQSLGIRGSMLCAVGMLPQILFYIPAFLVVLIYCGSQPPAEWNRQKTVFVFFTMCIGVLLELYVNPVLVRMYLLAFF